MSALFTAVPVIWAVRPLFATGFLPTHDGEYHIIRFWQFYKMLTAGILFPRWAPDLNSGYGLPIFNFHYPLPNYIGSFYHAFGASFVRSFPYVLATGYLACCVFVFLWIRKLFGSFSAWAGTVAFAFTPYVFVELYVRGSVGEVLSLVFVMAAFVCIEYGRKYALAFTIAGIVLSHNIMAMMIAPVILVYMWVRKKAYYLQLLLGLGLSCYFWLPALTESAYMLGLNTVSYADHFPELFQLLIPSWGTGLSVPGINANEMSFQIGVMPIFMIILAVILVIREKNTVKKKYISVFIIIFFGAMYLITGWSRFFWDHVTVLSLVQYPWRFLSVILVTVPVIAGYVGSRIPRLLTIVLVVLLVVGSASYARPVLYSPRDDSHYLGNPIFTDGTSSMGNSLSTIWSPWISTRALDFLTSQKKNITVIQEEIGYTDSFAKVSVTDKTQVQAHRTYFPGWTVTVDGQSVPIDYRTDGTIRFDLLPGQHEVRIAFLETPVRRIAETISIISLFWICGLSILTPYACCHRRITHKKQS